MDHERPFYLLGHLRSGSTLLARALAQDSQVCLLFQPSTRIGAQTDDRFAALHESVLRGSASMARPFLPAGTRWLVAKDVYTSAVGGYPMDRAAGVDLANIVLLLRRPDSYLESCKAVLGRDRLGLGELRRLARDYRAFAELCLKLDRPVLSTEEICRDVPRAVSTVRRLWGLPRVEASPKPKGQWDPADNVLFQNPLSRMSARALAPDPVSRRAYGRVNGHPPVAAPALRGAEAKTAHQLVAYHRALELTELH